MADADADGGTRDDGSGGWVRTRAYLGVTEAAGSSILMIDCDYVDQSIVMNPPRQNCQWLPGLKRIPTDAMRAVSSQRQPRRPVLDGKTGN